jgi:hypothetical protein
VVKYFRFKWDEVVWDLGYTNLVMLMATIPVYETDEDEKPIDLGNDTQSLANFINNLK